MTDPTTSPARRSGGRSAMIAAGACLLLLGLASLGVGGVLLAVHATQRDGSGFYASGTNPVSTPTHALVAGRLDVGTDGPDWLFRKGRLGTLRVTATGTATRPVFVGIAPRNDVNRYLRGVAYDEIRDFELEPFAVATRHHAGTAAPVPPAGDGVWAASASGTGAQTLEWNVRKGDWAVVLMNADGTPGVTTSVGVGARLPFLPWLGAGLAAFGLLAATGGGVLIAAGSGRLPRARPEPGRTEP